MTVEVCTVWAPRKQSAQWRDEYEDLLFLQRATARRFGHRHVVVTDDTRFADDADALIETLPDEVMPAMIAGVLRRLLRPVHDPIVFVDVDVLIARELTPAFDGTFDLGLTRRVDAAAPINNGAMYVAAPLHPEVVNFFFRAFGACGKHWGADQEAISAVAHPVPDHECVEVRRGMRLAFLSMLSHNVIPKTEGKPHRANPYVVHFKGDTKAWAKTYADKFVLVP